MLSTLALLYVGLFSMLIGFIFWYRGLDQCGISNIGQLQFLQPFLSLVLAAVILDEPIGWSLLVVMALVICSVAAARRFALMRRRLFNRFPSGQPPLLLDRRISMASLIQTLAVTEYLDHFHVANTFGAAQSGLKGWIRVLEEDFSIFLALAFNLVILRSLPRN